MRFRPCFCFAAPFVAWLLLFTAVASLQGAGKPADQIVVDNDELGVRLLVTPIASEWSGEGFMPVRVRAENRAAQPRAWTLRFRVNNNYRDALEHVVTVAVEPRASVERVFFVPGPGAAPGTGNIWMQVAAEGPGAGGMDGLLHSSGRSPLVIAAVSAAQETALFAATNGAPGPQHHLTVVDFAAWPADWRTWSPFQRVVLTDDEFSRMPAAHRSALEDWVSMGGVLDLYAARGGGRGASSGPVRQPSGLGVIRRFLSFSLADQAAAKVAFEPELEPWSDLPELSAERREELKLEAGGLGLSLFLLAFGVLVGPVNLFVFAPANRRHRLFFTVPAISLGASVLLAGYIVVKDGFGGVGSQRGLVMLLPEDNQAVVTQRQVTRTGVLLGAEFQVPDDVVLNQEAGDVLDPSGGLFGRRYSARAAAYARGAGSASGDWFASRRVQAQTLRQLVPTRARVELIAAAGARGEGSAPVVQSSLGVVLRDFCFVDRQGDVWKTANLSPGRETTLAKRVDFAPEDLPLPGRFVARGGAAEGLTPIPTLGSIRWDEPEFIYTGPVVEGRQP